MGDSFPQIGDYHSRLDLIVIKVEEHGFISGMIYLAKVLNHDFSYVDRFFVEITLHTKNC